MGKGQYKAFLDKARRRTPYKTGERLAGSRRNFIKEDR
jgi:hypothetical protein